MIPTAVPREAIGTAPVTMSAGTAVADPIAVMVPAEAAGAIPRVTRAAEVVPVRRVDPIRELTKVLTPETDLVPRGIRAARLGVEAEKAPNRAATRRDTRALVPILDPVATAMEMDKAAAATPKVTRDLVPEMDQVLKEAPNLVRMMVMA